MSFSVMAQEKNIFGDTALVPDHVIDTRGIPMGDSFIGFMTCEVVDMVVIGFKDGKTTRYSGVENSFEIGDKMTLEVQYNTSGLVPQFMIEQTEEVEGFYPIKEIIYANDEYTKYPVGAVLTGGLSSESIINSNGFMKIDEGLLGTIHINRYYKDDYEISYAFTEMGEADRLYYFNCPNSGALTISIDKIFDYASKLPNNIKSN